MTCRRISCLDLSCWARHTSLRDPTRTINPSCAYINDDNLHKVSRVSDGIATKDKMEFCVLRRFSAPALSQPWFQHHFDCGSTVISRRPVVIALRRRISTRNDYSSNRSLVMRPGWVPADEHEGVVSYMSRHWRHGNILADHRTCCMRVRRHAHPPTGQNWIDNAFWYARGKGEGGR